jgi:hypothetical protein
MSGARAPMARNDYIIQSHSAGPAYPRQRHPQQDNQAMPACNHVLIALIRKQVRRAIMRTFG